MRFIERFPVGFFGASATLAALALACRAAVGALGLPAVVADWFGKAALVVFALLALIFALKLLFYRRTVAAELRSLLTGPLYAVVPVALLLLSGFVLPNAPGLGRRLWLAGVLLLAVIGLVLAWRLLRHSREVAQWSLAWFMVPIACMSVGIYGPLMTVRGARQFSDLMLAVGAVLAVTFLVVLVARRRAEVALPGTSPAAMMILVAPFVVGFLAYLRRGATVGFLVPLLFWVAILLLLAFIRYLPSLWSACPFRIGWWAAGMPLAILSLAGFRYAGSEGGMIFYLLAGALLALASAVALVLLCRTLIGILRGELSRLEG
jgi:tellurite resistance protein